jgi:uncharacterized Tic20 family protein
MYDTEMPNREERMWAMLCHLVCFAQFMIPMGGIIGPLTVWLIKREEFPLVDDQGKEALNFQISVFIYAMIFAILILVIIGIPLLIFLGIFEIVMIIVAAVKANEGVPYRYPLNLRLIK